MFFDTIVQPTLILDEIRCKANIQRLCQKAREQGVVLRPHFKTHQSKAIGQWFREEGIDRITVSSVGMAKYFADAGWKDITIAFPVNIRQVEEIKDLASRIMLGLLVLDKEAVDFLGKHLHVPVSVWIKIDVGTHRTGILPEDVSRLEAMTELLRKYPHLVFKGFLAHAGHTYHSRSVTEVQRIYDQSLAILLDLKKAYADQFPDLSISLGDTPGASMVGQFGTVDELRPGNFVFYDLMQAEIGACGPDDIAVAMACPVVAVHPDRMQWIIYGGAIHFSKDYLTIDGGRKCFGRMVGYDDNTWSAKNVMENPYLISLSQEHGIVQCNEHNFDLCRPGDLSFWLPVHSCLTADVMGEFYTTDGRHVDHYRQRVNK
jgi:D-serine deaminase-like pyridoxal phosphate-dependent protein